MRNQHTSKERHENNPRQRAVRGRARPGHGPSEQDLAPGALQRALTGPPSTLTSANILTLQRGVGNRAVQRLMAQGAATRSASPARRTTDAVEPPRSVNKVSPEKRGSLIQLMQAQAGNVTFNSQITQFDISPEALDFTNLDNKKAMLDAGRVEAEASVKAAGPKQEVDQWQAGFHQTISRSERNFYYDSSARTKATDYTDVPTKDGETGSIFYWGKGKKFKGEESFEATPDLTDKPYTPSDSLEQVGTWHDPKAADEGDHLHHTGGEDCFSTWLVVAKRADESSPIILDRRDWHINWASQLTEPRVLMPGGGTFKGQGSTPAAGPEFGAENKPQARFEKW